jgi:hypothetical protein
MSAITGKLRPLQAAVTPGVIATLADRIAPGISGLFDVRSVPFTTRHSNACFACGTDWCRNFKAV